MGTTGREYGELEALVGVARGMGSVGRDQGRVRADQDGQAAQIGLQIEIARADTDPIELALGDGLVVEVILEVALDARLVGARLLHQRQRQLGARILIVAAGERRHPSSVMGAMVTWETGMISAAIAGLGAPCCLTCFVGAGPTQRSPPRPISWGPSSCRASPVSSIEHAGPTRCNARITPCVTEEARRTR